MCSFFRQFVVRVSFVCLFFPILAGAQESLIVVDFSDATLSFYSGDILMVEFPVVVPYPAEEPPKLPVRGIVKRIEKNPSWYPTKRTQNVFLEKRKIVLPKVVKSDNPLNPLGTVKVIVDWHDPNKSTARIHGTNEPGLFSLPPERRHRSGGCIRLLNKDADKLVSLIQSEAAPVRVLYTR